MRPMQVGGDDPHGPIVSSYHDATRGQGPFRDDRVRTCSWKSPRFFILSLLGLIILIVLVVGIALNIGPTASNSSTKLPEDGEAINGYDPDIFELELEQDLALAKEVTAVNKTKETGTDDLDQDLQFPLNCKSRIRDNPGSVEGAKIQFVHIPQNGGNSIEQAMRQWGRGRIFKTYSIEFEGSNTICPPGATSSVILAGHRGYGFCDEVYSRHKAFFSFTVLREPTARLVALFDSLRMTNDVYYNRVFGSLSLNDLVKQYNMTKRIESGESLLKYLASQQSRYMCGYECFLPRNKSWNEPSYLLDKALRNLNETDVVGVTIRMNDVIDQLKMHLSWLPEGFKLWPRVNTARFAKSRLDDMAKNILLEWSKEDVKLYQQAITLSRIRSTEARKCLAAGTNSLPVGDSSEGSPINNNTEENNSKPTKTDGDKVKKEGAGDAFEDEQP